MESEPGDCVLSYSDALIEAHDTNGEDLGEKGVLRIAKLLGDVEPEKLIETLLRESAANSPENLTEDDVTVLVVRANGRPSPVIRSGQKLSAMLRLSGSLLRSVHPRAERAPLPDANLANIPGAIIPALARRWRAARKSG